MIWGIGTDIVEVGRMRRLHARHGERLAHRLLAGEELAAYGVAADPARFLAKRFAAKEALAKAVGTGLRDPVHLTRMAVRHDPLGRPVFAFGPELEAWLASRRITRVHLSLSDELHYALGFVLVEGEDGP